MRNTASSGRFRASASVQPVRRSATGFIVRMRPVSSVAITASPMLTSVVRNHASELAVTAAMASAIARAACSRSRSRVVQWSRAIAMPTMSRATPNPPTFARRTARLSPFSRAVRAA